MNDFLLMCCLFFTAETVKHIASGVWKKLCKKKKKKKKQSHFSLGTIN